MLDQWLTKRWQEVTAAVLLLLSQGILTKFEDQISTATQTVSDTPLLLRLLSLSVISCAYLGLKLWTGRNLTSKKRLLTQYELHPETGTRRHKKTGQLVCPQCLYRDGSEPAFHRNGNTLTCEALPTHVYHDTTPAA